MRPERQQAIQCVLGMCWLVARRKILTGMMCQGRLGHTHGREDRKFAIMARCLQRRVVFQDPSDFATRNEETLTSSTHGKLVIEKLTGALRSRDLFARLPPYILFSTALPRHSLMRSWIPKQIQSIIGRPKNTCPLEETLCRNLNRLYMDFVQHHESGNTSSRTSFVKWDFRD